MKYTPIISSNIHPTDVKIYIEDNVPYLDYVGTFYAADGSKCKVHFPKIGLTFSKVTQEKEEEEYDYFGYKQRVITKFDVYAVDDKWAEFEVIERDVSKKQLENELGYKLNIKE